MDRIFLHGMRFMACHGALPHEREVPQAFETFPCIRSVTLTVHKPAAPIAGIFADVGVSITRDRG